MRTIPAALVLVILLSGCNTSLNHKGDTSSTTSSSTSTVAGPTASASCTQCHTSITALNAAKASPALDASTLVVSTKFIMSAHAVNGCPSCHRGNPQSGSKAGAHENLVADPVADGGEAVCGRCHPDIVSRHKTSLHYTTNGLKQAFFSRLKQVDPTGKMANSAWRSKACVNCHASCGTCHITRPRDPWVTSGPKGLLSGHEILDFKKKADTEKTCYVCHAGSIADPEAGFQKQDVHNKAGMDCMSCHNEKEVHGDGVERMTMIHSGAVTAECTNCHQKARLTGRVHSSTHLDRATCQSCHSMPYRNCTECHGWQRIIDQKSPPFKIVYAIKLGLSHGKITTLVKGPVDSKMLADEGIPEIPADKLNTQSSWYAGAPHNVVRPKPDQELCNRCHGPGTALLKDSDLQFPDFEKKHLLTPLTPVDASSMRE